jgi:GNAT superfamily N-acetyltransferase
MNTRTPPTSPDRHPALALRRAEERDAAAIAGLLATPQDLRQVSPEEEFPLDAATVRHWIRERGAGFVLEDRGGVVAYAELVPDAAVRGRVWVGHMMVDPHRRGLGLGQRLVRGLLEVAGQRRAREVAISAFVDNPRALRCYRSCGFVDRGRVRVGARDLLELRYRVPAEQPAITRSTAAGAAAVGTAAGTLTLLSSWSRLDWVALTPLLLTLAVAVWAGHGIVPRQRVAMGVRLLRTVTYATMIGAAVWIVATVLYFVRGLALKSASIAIATGTITVLLLLVFAARRAGRPGVLEP